MVQPITQNNIRRCKEIQTISPYITAIIHFGSSILFYAYISTKITLIYNYIYIHL
jgi:hypothetical protein